MPLKRQRLDGYGVRAGGRAIWCGMGLDPRCSSEAWAVAAALRFVGIGRPAGASSARAVREPSGRRMDKQAHGLTLSLHDP